MARRKPHIPEALLTYYRHSVSGSVIEAYREKNIVIVDADHPQVTLDTPEIREAEVALMNIQEEIDTAYWLFSRSASRGPGKLADPTLYARRNAARYHLMDVRRLVLRQHSQDIGA